MSASKKPHMNLVVVGHVDNGKSTIVGHLLVDMGVIDQRTIDSFAKESEETGKGDTFKVRLVLDSIKDEEKEESQLIWLSKNLKLLNIFTP